MEAGRELDALVAEKVFQRKVEEHSTFDMFPYGTTTAKTPQLVWSDNAVIGESGYVAMPFEGTKDTRRFVPHYSTDIAAAWLVVEKWLPHFRIECHEDSEYVDPPEAQYWHCDIWYDGGHACVTGIATAPLAICLAALKAVGVDV